MKPLIIPGVPEQVKGSFHDSESYRDFHSSETALENYQILKAHFTSVNNWKTYCDGNSADFKLFDGSGNPIDRKPQEDDLIRIDIPGPGNPESGGYEWVKITKISDQSLLPDEIESLLIKCVPTKIPGQNENEHISHFYSVDSASTFKIARGKKFIKIGVYGRNETPNMNTTFNGKIRNLLIALGGMFGMSKTQWKIFAEKMLKF